ncbi:SDR family NAD(P)-dependent oxidoreductase [Corynebacterium sphenisci]|uniref:SDR family NAD(P)-dependent oxidoreductase n=1 Tax=Corynebacterium sphenisci TaxID=191493 RepID=UPI0026DEE6BD|nr:SDR family NAD(P)-dependent oxidoreductase [Corynebacterium sphenisci]MDO5731736.1 SDR family NAD(P)-dependent oxidoreductase [Corynebacterium sphenisci]
MRTPTTVAITGAARGIGRATAGAFLAAGADVAIGDLDAAAAAQAAAELAAAHPGRVVLGLGLDVADPASMGAFLDAAKERLGGLDAVVNNAGIMPTTVFAEEPAELSDQTIDVNLRGVVHGTKAALSRLSPDGVVVNVSSQVTNLPAPALATYTATKAGVLGLDEALGRELAASGSRIRLLAVLPGIIRTELSAGANHRRWLDPVLVADPERVAAAILAGVRRRRRRVAVPAILGPATALLRALPYPLRRAAERALGLDVSFTAADPAARARYHARIDAARAAAD